MFKKTTTLLLLLPTLLFAHEFWLSPGKYRPQVGETISLNFYAGMPFEGEVWWHRSERTLKLTQYSLQGVKDLTPLAVASDSVDMFMSFEQEGTHLLAMESKNAFIGLDAEDFNNYLKEDGLYYIYELREKKGELEKPAREYYRRCAKALLQVGDKADDTYKKVTGMVLEIVPQNNPYTLKEGEEMVVKVLFNGKPLSGNTIYTWNKHGEQPTQQQEYQTDKKGRLRFVPDQKGQWMISLVRMEALKDNPKADYQSYWGTLTFEL